MKKIIIMFAAVLAIATLSEVAEAAKPKDGSAVNKAKVTAKEVVEAPVKPIEAETNDAVASKVDAMEKASVDKRSLTRQEIRNMPILERPNRPGHIYGNTVRRRYNRSLE
ncbi:MAG: hypothetical protein Q4C70_14905 [Planctomycetia bacterium]|nr:hypothetical protein [Planctomycetia bacterium]